MKRIVFCLYTDEEKEIYYNFKVLCATERKTVKKKIMQLLKDELEISQN